MKVRAEAMQMASEVVPSGMMTVFHGSESKLTLVIETAKKFLERQENFIDREQTPIDCKIASYLHPECKVIAGNIEVSFFFNNVK